MRKVSIPYIPDHGTLIKVCLSILISTFFILYFFQPFGDITHGFTLNGFVRIFSYAFVASGTVYLIESLLGVQFRSKSRIAQTRFGGLTWYFVILLFVTITIFLCRTLWIGWSGFSIWSLLIVIYRVAVISIIPFSIVAFILLLQKEKSPDFHVLLASNDVNPEHLKLGLKDILYLASEENYTSIFIRRSDEVEKKLLRGSLTYFENQISPPLIRVHRSYVINLQQIVEVKMNSSGGSIQLNGSDMAIPISRKHLTTFQNHWSRIN